jgi:hypothetical protein
MAGWSHKINLLNRHLAFFLPFPGSFFCLFTKMIIAITDEKNNTGPDEAVNNFQKGLHYRASFHHPVKA